MRPASTPVPPPETEIEPPGVPGLSGLLTLAVGVVVLAALYVGREVFLPVVLGANGLERVFEIELTDDEQAAFDRSAAAVRELVDKLG